MVASYHSPRRLVIHAGKCETPVVYARCAALAVFALMGACGGNEPVESPHATPSASASAPVVVTPPAPHDTAYKLVITTASCLLGGLWADTEGEAGASERRAAIARRCGAAARAISGEDDPMKVESLKMLDASMTDPLVAKVKAFAANDELDDEHAAALQKLASSLVAAAREAAAARRAAAKIRGDIEKLHTDKEKASARERDADRLSADEAAVAGVLRSGAALDALVKFSAPDYATDAHAIGVLLALSRVRAAQDLPKHMKLYTVAPAYAAVFGAKPPPLPEHAKDRLKPGTWLAYVVSVANACGHPVDASIKKPRDKEALAWSGVLAGFADRLKSDQPQIKDEGLAEAVKGTIERLEARSAAAASEAAH